MRLRVNDQDTELSDNATVTDLLTQLNLSGTRVAIEVNQHLVRRVEHPTTILHAGDRVEIVTLVGGG